MTDKPIIFSAPMIRALLDGRKTQTRRVLKPQPMAGGYYDGALRMEQVYQPDSQDPDSYVRFSADAVGGGAITEEMIKLPYAPSDRLWVREAWSGEHWLADVKPSERLLVGNPSRLVSMIPETWYWADGSPNYGDWEKPRPSIHMPLWASRLTLTVTDVRVQRVQEISTDDAIAEGRPEGGEFLSARYWFHGLWNSLHGPDAWGANPWVVCLSFDVHRCNIDQMEPT